jgi:hypothetical protein
MESKTMRKVKLNNRVVVDIEVDGIDTRDYPDFCDAYFSGAAWEDTGESLTADELEQLQDENPELLYDKVIDHVF